MSYQHPETPTRPTGGPLRRALAVLVIGLFINLIPNGPAVEIYDIGWRLCEATSGDDAWRCEDAWQKEGLWTADAPPLTR